MKKIRQKKPFSFIPYFFMAPSIIFLLAFITYPLMYSFFLSFTEYNYVYDEVSRFNGIMTYIELLKDETFIIALKNTMIFAALYFFGVIVFSFIIALIINEIKIGKTVYQLAVYLPIIVPLSLAGVTFVWILDPTFGVLNFVLKHIGIGPISWLSNSSYALFTLVGMKIWKFMGFSVIIFLAGLQSVPKGHYEAAEMNGANFFQKTLYITIPEIKEYTLMASLYQIVQAMKVFELPFVATRGGPGNATLTLYLYSWRSAFSHFDLGNAAAAAYVTAAIILVATMAAKRVLRSE